MEIRLIYDYAYFFILYSTIHFASDYIITSIFNKKLIKQLNKDDRIELGEKISSTVNGIITGSIGVYVLFYQNAFKNDIYTPYNDIMDTFFTNLVGYSLYDLTVMCFQSRSQEAVSYVIHHLCCLVGSLLAPVYKAGCFFPIIFGITELTVITNNFTWYLQRLGYKHSDPELYKTSLFIRVLIFVLIRQFCGFYSIYYAIQNPGPIPAGYSIVQSLSFFDKLIISYTNFMKMSWIPCILNFICPMMFVLLNIVWSYVMITNFINKTKTRID